MYLYLPVALTSINILIPVGLGLAVGLLSGLFGVGGGFLLTPLAHHVRHSLDRCSGDRFQPDRGGVDLRAPMRTGRSGTWISRWGCTFSSAVLSAASSASRLIKLLHAMGNADFVIKMTYVLMLGIVGVYMFIESLQSMRKKKNAVVKKQRKRKSRPWAGS